jgi:tetratricopeptide (TPR) repeat protein
LYSLGHYQEALASFDRAVGLKFDQEMYWTNRGNALRQLGQIENALASYNTALSINPAYSQAQRWHRVVLEALEQKNKAMLEELNEHKQTSEEEANRLAFHRALLASGLVRQIKQPPRSQPSERQLIQVQGKPVSETIIEERR